jgi:hypothetical protein
MARKPLIINVVQIETAEVGLDGIDWRNPVFTWRPEVAG